MTPRRSLRTILFVTGAGLVLAGAAWSAESGISKTPDATGRFCHLKFPAIREDTLYSDRPMLKDAGSGDIVDIYAPCDYDPLGKDEFARQQAHRRHLRDHHLYSD